MIDFAVVLAGLGDAFTLNTLAYVLAGVAIGQIVGAIPGLSIVMALAIAVPLTFTLDTLAAISFLIAVNKGGTVGGAVPAILLNTPGTPESAATALDGHPMARQGKPLKAMKYGLYYSIFGDTSSDIVLITVSLPLALLALRMGPVEITALMIFAFTIITGLVGRSMIKGLVAAALGFLVATVGLDPALGTPRFTFGQLELYDGLPLTALAVGMLAVSEILQRMAEATRGTPSTSAIGNASTDPADNRVTFQELLVNRGAAIRGFVVGTLIGAIPGLGSATAGFLNYAMTKKASKDPDSFGKGNPAGIAASESANSAAVGANLIPLLTLGIPGNIAAALLVSALMIHGVQPGPLMFENQARLIYGFFGAMLIANVMNLVVAQFGMRLWIRVVSAPTSVIYPGALALCIAGVYLSSGGMFGVWVMLAAAAAGYVMNVFGYSIVAFIVAFVLAPLLERSITQSILITGGRPEAILSHPVAMGLLALAALSLVLLNRRSGPATPRAGGTTN